MKSTKQTYEEYWQGRSSSGDLDNNTRFPNEIIEVVAPLLNKGIRVLDIGCGNGFLSKIAEEDRTSEG